MLPRPFCSVVEGDRVVEVGCAVIVGDDARLIRDASYPVGSS